MKIKTLFYFHEKANFQIKKVHDDTVTDPVISFFYAIMWNYQSRETEKRNILTVTIKLFII